MQIGFFLSFALNDFKIERNCDLQYCTDSNWSELVRSSYCFEEEEEEEEELYNSE